VQYSEPPLPHLTGAEELPEELPLPPGFRGWLVWLFRVPNLPNPRSKRDIVRWWERRRLAYNILVGSVGLVSFIVFVVWSSTRPDSPRPFYYYMFLPVVAGIVLNICYTTGWFVEIVGFMVGIRSRKVGPALLIGGLLLSLAAVTLGAW